MANPLPTTPFSLAALATEIAQDPKTLGYAAAGNDVAVAALLNLPSGAGSGPVWKTSIPALMVLQTIVSADFLALTSLQLQQLNTMLAIGTFDATNANTGATFAAIFTGKTNTLNAFNAMAQRTGSRAEVLWGIGTVISAQQIGQSRNGV